MFITIQLLNHKKISIIAQPDNNVSLIKHKIAEELEVNITDIKFLIYNKENLDDYIAISEYNIDDNSILVAVIMSENETIYDLLKVNNDDLMPSSENITNPFLFVSEDDNNAITQFTAMGFNKTDVISNYFISGKNADLTLDLLLNGTRL